MPEYWLVPYAARWYNRTVLGNEVEFLTYTLPNSLNGPRTRSLMPRYELQHLK